MGDTDIFGDMALIQELHQPQIGIVPIGDRFTMGGAVAALACRRYFKFDTILPCHYASFPIIDQTADKFLNAMEGDADKVKIIEIGEPISV
jgi:L-ascorbate metabolism protein UlaG (beta-lactamase superfamily)